MIKLSMLEMSNIERERHLFGAKSKLSNLKVYLSIKNSKTLQVDYDNADEYSLALKAFASAILHADWSLF